ncbi:hypothetical protein [Robiginitalea sp. IMCC43444]|uniref:hypothetical protein n=1 Tax=Robiginitalea sp. IMCC43444 TaxID=3459121 RepID=UPI004041275C
MSPLKIDYKTITENANQKSMFTKYRIELKPVIQGILRVFQEKPVLLCVAGNGRKQIQFTRKIEPMIWK